MDARVARALTQRMYLLGAQRGFADQNLEHPQWKLKVQGAKGNPYTVTLSEASQGCSCPDHVIRKLPCKHMYFVAYRIAGLTHEVAEWFHDIDAKLYDRLQLRPAAQVSGECAICFEPVNAEGTTCHQCKHPFHQSCAERWRAHCVPTTCPLCRAVWSGSNRDIALTSRVSVPPKLLTSQQHRQLVRGIRKAIDRKAQRFATKQPEYARWILDHMGRDLVVSAR